MKICFFTTDFPPTIGGISEFSRSIAFHMPGFPDVEHVQVIALKNKKRGVEKPNEKLSIIRDDKQSLLYIFWNVFRYAFRFKAYDVFHATSIFPVGFLTVLIGKYIFRKPVFVTFYGTDVLSNLGSQKTKWAKVWTLKHATKAIAFSYSTRDEAARRHNIPLEQFAMVYYPLPDKFERGSPEEISALKRKFKISDDDFIILFVGHLVRRKGPEDLIKALSKISNPKIKIIFVGSGPLEEELKLQARSYNLEARVIFVGEHNAVPFYDIAHVFSMPSFFEKTDGDIEGLGIVFLEAEQRGIPVIGTESGGVPEAIDKNKSGFIVPERDIEAIAEKIQILNHDPQLSKRMGESGKQFVKEKFNWRKSVEGHLDLYERSLT